MHTPEFVLLTNIVKQPVIAVWSSFSEIAKPVKIVRVRVSGPYLSAHVVYAFYHEIWKKKI